jgi:DNA (cytosine-5)-methyltransferase 1
VEVPVREDQAGAVHKARRTTEEGQGREVVKYLSVCSGIEAASVAWHPLGWEPVGFAEIEKFPSQVLAHRFPGVKNYGDMTKFKEWNIERGAVDLLVGGTPCQAFSVAGLRKGLADPRGNLALTFVAMVDHYRPEWVVFENVPGVLSSNGGRDFGAFLGALGQLGYGWCYRVLDAQYFGVAQRRRRVFVVAHASGDPRRCASVLFEPESLCGDPPPSREAGQGIASGAIAGTVSSKWAKGTGGPAGDECYNLTAVYESHPNDSRVTGPVEQCPTVSAQWGTGVNNTPLVTDGEASAFSWQCRGDMRGMVPRPTAQLQRCQIEAVMTEPAMHVRRLTPVECERLQGFPDGWTDIRPNGKDTPDSPRYKALGNSMAVPVMRWIGMRIAQSVQ